jgi:hypothetical protein
VRIESADNDIGGPLVGRRNVPSGNEEAGVTLFGPAATSNRVRGNWIGLSVDGRSAVPNGTGVSIAVGAAANSVGGTGPSDGNVISGNTLDGVFIVGDGTDGNTIARNAFGAAGAGPGAVGNGRSAVAIADADHTSVGQGPEEGNLFMASGRDGIYLNRADHTVIVGALVNGNTGHGVSVNSSADSIVPWNVIFGNGGDGVRIQGPESVRNMVGMGSIHSNVGKGLGLAGSANGDIARPTIAGGSSSVVSGTACPGCAGQVYSDDADEGRTLEAIAHANDATGSWMVAVALGGPNVTALATDAAKGTSEFSSPFALGSGSSFVVDDPGDGPDLHDDAPGDGTCRAMVGGCTLRAGIEEANALQGRDRITFARAMTIQVDPDTVPELTLSEPAVVDAGGVWDAAGDRPGVTIDGGGTSGAVLTIDADGCAVYGFADHRRRCRSPRMGRRQ